jgi:hypothetical protein
MDPDLGRIVRAATATLLAVMQNGLSDRDANWQIKCFPYIIVRKCSF